jgi:hypothetical protein
MSSRGPLVARPPPHQSPSTHGRIVRSQGSLTKRPRSPEAAADARTKRARASNTPAAPDPPPRDERRADREAYKDEFRQKYRKGFPHWVFHFDADIPPGATLDRVQSDIEYLGGVRRPHSLLCTQKVMLINRSSASTTSSPQK